MADGMTWDDLPTELQGPGAETYFWAPGHNLEAVTDAEYLEITRADEYDGLMEHCRRVMAG